MYEVLKVERILEILESFTLKAFVQYLSCRNSRDNYPPSALITKCFSEISILCLSSLFCGSHRHYSC